MLVAIRPGGPILIATTGNRLIDLRGRKPRRYSCRLSDLVGIDWEVINREAFGKRLAAMRAAELAAAPGGEGGPANER
jgi:hypothetical protein